MATSFNLKLVSTFHLRQFSINGKAVTLRGTIDAKTGAPTSVIDGQDSIRVLRCVFGEGDDTVFENLLITGGRVVTDSGGGMLCSKATRR